MGQSGFFNKNRKASDEAKTNLLPAKSAKISDKRVLVNVGGKGDCGFRAVAATLIDNILGHPEANQALTETIFKLHARYYIHQPQITELVNYPVARTKFLLELAYVLRQITVDELCRVTEDDELYAQYRGAFVSNNEGTDPKSMRDPYTWIDETAIFALSNRIKVPIEISVVEQGKEIPALFYNENMQNPLCGLVKIQLQKQHYFAFVENPDYFVLLDPSKSNMQDKLVAEVNQTHIADAVADSELPEILEKIAKTDELLLKKFQDTSTQLRVMVEDGDLDKESLIDIYIEGLKNSDYLQGYLKYGTQHFFEMIESACGRVKPIISRQENNHDYEEKLVDELIKAVARAITIGQLDYSVCEQPGSKASYGA